MENKTKSSGLIASIVTCVLAVSGITACKEEPKTIYDYLTNEPLLNSVLNDCKSGKLDNKHTCNNVKRANGLLDNYKSGLLTEERLKELGKK
ncbi:hypothetical protein A1D25_02625 [Ursidibacter arcticus]|uniref:EexN family lipoprotein n=1 Tax=Ursidibacter arcticus TaxID=1524965 RepID=UPI0012FCECDB|nr:EexN family lipoprotein [Ursidibacter arcticus]KAE9537753.1 hypothetical protein A1D25_02625 [Ursidibacter arcticus]